MIDKTVEYSKDFNLNFNAEKSFIMFYSSNYTATKEKIFMGNSEISIVKQGKHLGFDLNDKRCLYDIEHVINDMNKKTNILKSNFYSLNNECKGKLFNSHCMSLYGCELWDFEDIKINRLEVGWRKCIKSFLQLPIRTRSKLLPDLISSDDIKTIIYNRQLNFYIKGLSHENLNIRFYFRNALTSCMSFASKNLNLILHKFDMPYETLFQGKKQKLIVSGCDELWRINIIKELCTLKNQVDYANLTKFEIKTFLGYVCTF